MLKSKYVVYGPKNIQVPVHLNFGQFILDQMWTIRNQVCLINGQTDERLTNGVLCQQAMNLAISLTRIGVLKGDVIAICSENRMEFFPTVVGVACTGAIIATVNIGYFKGELKHAMNISKPKYVICSPNAYKKYEKTFKTFDFVEQIIVYGDEKPKNVLLYNELVTPINNDNGSGFENGIKNGTDVFLKENVKYEDFVAIDVKGQSDTLFILCSSGTTGLPKGVMLTHSNMLAACCVPTSKTTPLVIAPWYHAMGLAGSLTNLLNGRAMVFLPNFEVELYLKTIEKYKVNQLTVVPPVVVAVTKSNLKYDVSSVKFIACGAAPLVKDTIEAINIRFPKAQVSQGYGLTEFTVAVTRATGDEPQFIKPGGVGRVLMGCVKIVDPETNTTLGPYQRGEILVKGPCLMKGYVGSNPKKDFDEDGYYRTGDIGYYDEDEVFFIVDRLKELIKYKGFQVPPAEIEGLLFQHPSVKDAGVIGIEDKIAGEVPLAFIVRQPGSNVSEEEIQLFVAERLSNPKHLRGGVRFVDEIPKNPTGKILRKVLRTMAKPGKSKL